MNVADQQARPATWTIWQAIVWLCWRDEDLTARNLRDDVMVGTLRYPPPGELMTMSEASAHLLSRLQQGLASFKPSGEPVPQSLWLVQNSMQRAHYDYQVLTAEFPSIAAMRERPRIVFTEIIDACATPPGDLKPDPGRRDGALDKLLEYFKNGGFEYCGKSAVTARSNRGRDPDPSMSWHDFERSLNVNPGNKDHLRRLCDDMDIPRAFARQWFRAYKLPLPVGWFPEAERGAQDVVLPKAGGPRPKPSERAVITWIENRVATWSDSQTAPSEATDWQAASSYFGEGLMRDDFRDLRRKYTPQEWQRQGRRLPWGKVKPSNG